MKNKIKKNGDCYEVAFQMVIDQTIPGALLVHGIVSGQRELTGYRFGHAWNELNGFVFDFSIKGKQRIMSKVAYYALGKIKEEEVVRYDKNGALKKAIETETYGPWHEDGLGKNGYKIEY